MQTELYSITDPEDQTAKAVLLRAGEILRNGGLVVFPTETVYGLGADATSPTAAEKIYAAKGRPSDNPLIVHIASPEDGEKYAEVGEIYYRLAQAFWPGPLTVIAAVKDSIPKTVTAGLPTVALRCPSHPVAQALLSAAAVPIAAPSANLSGSPSPTCARHVVADMQGRVNMILDGGDCEIGVESTIVKIESDGSLTLLRPGAVTLEMLLSVCPEVSVAEAVLGELSEGEVALSPGMKYRHYAPKCPLTLLDGSRENWLAYLEKSENTAVICYEEDYPFFSRHIPASHLFHFGGKKDLALQGQRLFTLLRDIDDAGFSAIVAPLPPIEGLGMALYNRMIRAAAHHILHL